MVPEQKKDGESAAKESSGAITAGRRIHLTATGKLFAEIETPVLIIDDAGFFQGHCTMPREAGKDGKTASPAPRLVQKAG